MNKPAKRKQRRIRWGRLLVPLFVCAGLIVLALPHPSDKETTSEPETETESPDTVQITATGDVLLEEPILNYFGSGDWKGYMDALAPYFEQDDLTIANQEVPIGGEEMGIEGIDYRFNAPTATAANLKAAGIDFVSLANNHAMDRGFEGIQKTHANLDAAGIGHTGTWTEEGQQDGITIQEVNGLRLAIVSYTYGCNLPADPAWSVNVFGSWQDEAGVQQLLEDVTKARETADAVIACMHWGTEFTYELNEDQTQLAGQIAQAGADVIIGNHPHCIQPAQWIETTDGRQVLCFYSLGNLVSSAYEVSRADEQFQDMYEVGALGQFTLTKEGQGVTVSDARIIPVVNHFENDYQDFQLIPLKNYTEDIAALHDQARYSNLFTAAWLQEQTAQVFSDPSIPIE